MKPHRGRPKSVDRGTERRVFLWTDLTGAEASTRYCSVTWMRHGVRIAAFAQYRNLDGVDITYLGMAHGEIDGLMYRVGVAREHTVPSLIGRDPRTQHDSIDAAMALAVLALEDAVKSAVLGDAGEEDDEHRWLRTSKADFEKRTGRKAVRT